MFDYNLIIYECSTTACSLNGFGTQSDGFSSPFLFITCKVANKDKQNNSPNLFGKPFKTTCTTLLPLTQGLHGAWKLKKVQPHTYFSLHKLVENARTTRMVHMQNNHNQKTHTHTIMKHNGYLRKQSTYLQTKSANAPLATIMVFACSIVAQSSTPKALCSNAPYLHMSHLSKYSWRTLLLHWSLTILIYIIMSSENESFHITMSHS